MRNNTAHLLTTSQAVARLQELGTNVSYRQFTNIAGSQHVPAEVIDGTRFFRSDAVELLSAQLKNGERWTTSGYMNTKAAMNAWHVSRATAKRMISKLAVECPQAVHLEGRERYVAAEEVTRLAQKQNPRESRSLVSYKTSDLGTRIPGT